MPESHQDQLFEDILLRIQKIQQRLREWEESMIRRGLLKMRGKKYENNSLDKPS